MQTTGNFLKENVWGEKKQMTSGKLARSRLSLPEGQRMWRGLPTGTKPQLANRHIKMPVNCS